MLLRSEERVSLPPRVFDLLLVLVENAGRLVSKETLMQSVWADSFVEEGNLNQTVSRLRRILGETPNETRFIETVPRVGYRFVADVELLDGAATENSSVTWPSSPKSSLTSDTGSATPPQSPPPNPPPAETTPDEIAERQSMRWLYIPLGLTVFVLVAFALWYFTRHADVAADGSKALKQGPVRLTSDPGREERPNMSVDGSIRFTRWEGNTTRAYVMASDGSDARRDTSVPGLRTGSWSPDGKKVLFYKDGDESGAIYTANADGSNETKLPFAASNMEWSPNGASIAYQTDSDIFLYTLETGTTTDLVRNPAFDADPSFSPDGKSLVFVSDRDGNPEIYIQSLDGSNLKRLTTHPAHDEFPTFSPDGTQIAFNSNREDENFDVYVMNADGSGVRRLTNWKSEEEIRPGCWSPDGTQILFASNKEGGGDIYKTSAELYPAELLVDGGDLHFPSYSPDGKQLMYVAQSADGSGDLFIRDLETKKDRAILHSESAEMFPKFSPDGKSVVVQHKVGGNAEICIVSAQGGEVQNLTNNPARDIQPAWSPDGSKIAFASNREGNYDVFPLYLMNADGTNQHRIYASYAINGFPSWSPSGTEIVFANDKEDNRTGNFELFLIEPETVNAEKRLTFHARYDIEPAFSPDGRRIAFASNADGNWEIYVVNSDGTGLLRLTRNPASEANPSWSPDSTKLIFSSDRSGRFALYEVRFEL